MRCISALLLLALPATAQDLREVDLELFLAVDVSRSMSPEELEIQRQGYAAALASAQVFDAIRSGLIGEIAVTYVEWAGAYSQKTVVPWTLIDTPQTAQDFAKVITAHFDSGMRRTSISGALDYAAASMDTNAFKGLRRVIDISGDGPNNNGDLVLPARARALAQGITINGLPLMTTDALSEMWGIPDLDVYYRECVIGGPGAFVLPVYEWADFPASIQRKLILEIAGLGAEFAPKPHVTQVSAYNCEVGEQIMERNRMLFSEP